MEIAEIKSDIEALPDSDLYNYEASDGRIYNYGGCDHYEIHVNAQHLKALCASHTALEAQVAEMNALITELEHGHYDEAVQERIEAYREENKDAR